MLGLRGWHTPPPHERVAKYDPSIPVNGTKIYVHLSVDPSPEGARAGRSARLRGAWPSVYGGRHDSPASTKNNVWASRHPILNVSGTHLQDLFNRLRLFYKRKTKWPGRFYIRFC